VIGGGQVSLRPSMYINNILLVDGLKHNLLSISQFCGSGNNVMFYKDKYTVYQHDGTKMFASNRQENLYKIDMDELSNQRVSCLMFEKKDHWL